VACLSEAPASCKMAVAPSQRKTSRRAHDMPAPPAWACHPAAANEEFKVCDGNLNHQEEPTDCQ